MSENDHDQNDQHKLLLAAVEWESLEERSAYLDELYGDDPQLRDSASAFLKECDQSGGVDVDKGSTADRGFPGQEAVAPGVDVAVNDPLPSERKEDDLPADLRRLVDNLARTPGTARLRRDTEIGRGGMGRVHLAHDEGLRRRCALKLLSPASGANASHVTAFLREAQIMAQLDHPNILPIHDVGVDDAGRLQFSMKLMTGHTFGDWINSFPRRPYQATELVRIIEVVIKICDALAFAHSRGIVHCDVTPGNVMIGEHGEVRLMDWGIARSIPGRPSLDQSGPRITTTTGPVIPHKTVGTPAFMSPEHVGAGVIDERTDVFQVGALLYFALTRSPIHPNCPPDAFVDVVIEQRITRPSELAPWAGIPPALERIVLKALATRPSDRHESAAELRSALTRFMWGGEAFDQLRFAAGEHIIHEGDMGECAYIIASGSVRVHRMVRGERVALCTMGEGEIFGEMAILASARRGASVVALTDCEVLVVDRKTIEAELEGAKPWMGALTRGLAARLKEREDDYLVPVSTRKYCRPESGMGSSD